MGSEAGLPVSLKWYGAAMKQNKSAKGGSITEPLLKKLLDRHKQESQQSKAEPTIGSKPLKPSDLYQGDGGGYNADLSFPQA